MIVLGIDVGTSSVKAAIVDVASDCTILAARTSTYPIEQSEPGAAEIHAEQLWNAIGQTVGNVIDGQGDQIAGIGLSCLTPALCLLDDADRPLGAFRKTPARRGSGCGGPAGRPLPLSGPGPDR